MNVTILGGTGVLGFAVASALRERGHTISIAGRSARTESDPAVRGVRIDLGSGEGVGQAIADAECVLHLASDPLRAWEVDVAGTGRLLELIAERHLVYMSIVGVDRHPLPYYRAKFAAERLIEDAGGLFTIVRATQFHDLIALRLERMTRFPVARVPMGHVYQPIDLREVAGEVAALVESRPQGRAPDLAGPEILGIEHLARTYMTAKGMERPLISYPKPGRVSRAFRQGLHTNPERAVGKVTWADHLQRRFADR
ncbi:MAG TPA: NAD(P)-dependent oxidoreductase [Acidimicrobiia bacterium]|nr:NAD(P)-dependent oxidoreductase [Acidimicrobiia bacterium]